MLIWLAVVGISLQGTPKIEFDVRRLEALKRFVQDAEALAKKEYPKTADVLGIPRSSLKDVKILIDFNYNEVAYADGTTIHVSAKYAAQHPDDTGLVVHELCHVAQGYPKYDPVWLVEGIADYVRWFAFEPLSKRPKVSADQANARASYRITGAFLGWAAINYNKDLIKSLNQALKTDTYKEELWRSLTGRDLDTLNELWKKSLTAK